MPDVVRRNGKSDTKDAATECQATECLGDPVPRKLSAQAIECLATECLMVIECLMGIECLVTQIFPNQTERWSQAIAARPVELEKEIWFKKRF